MHGGINVDVVRASLVPRIMRARPAHVTACFTKSPFLLKVLPQTPNECLPVLAFETSLALAKGLVAASFRTGSAGHGFCHGLSLHGVRRSRGRPSLPNCVRSPRRPPTVGANQVFRTGHRAGLEHGVIDVAALPPAHIVLKESSSRGEQAVTLLVTSHFCLETKNTTTIIDVERRRRASIDINSDPKHNSGCLLVVLIHVVAFTTHAYFPIDRLHVTIH